MQKQTSKATSNSRDAGHVGSQLKECKIAVIENLKTYEAGFTTVIRQIVPDSWKKAAGKDWESALNTIILHQSEDSFVQWFGPVEKYTKRNLGALRGLLEAAIGSKLFNLYYDFKDIHVAVMGDKGFLEKANEKQLEKAKKLGASLEVLV